MENGQTMQPLKGRVAVVAGATRGAGRGIACMLGEAGATVYCTGRSTRSRPRRRGRGRRSPFDLSGRPETIEETAELGTLNAESRYTSATMRAWPASPPRTLSGKA